MQKLSSIIGVTNQARGRVSYSLAYAYHNNKSLCHRTFSLTIADTALASAKVDSKDRCDILIDEDSGKGIICFSPEGDYSVTGKTCGKTIKISSAAAIEALPKLFPVSNSIREIEVISISRKSIQFLLPSA